MNASKVTHWTCALALAAFFSAIGTIGAAAQSAATIEKWREYAKQGNASAQHNLGVIYENGKGVPQNQKLAVHWYRKAAKQGFAKAQYNLGFKYDNGEGVPQNYKLAVHWYRKAAEQSMAWAQHNLGVMYDKGEGVPRNQRLAVHWYRKAAKQGLAEAQYNLGLMYQSGQGVLQDYVQAHKWFNLAATKRVKYRANRDRLAKRMTPFQIAEAQRLAREWKPKIRARSRPRSSHSTVSHQLSRRLCSHRTAVT
jgi:TPR repeat protein